MEYTEITSRKNTRLIAASKLCDKKERDISGLFFTEGSKLLGEVLLAGLEITTLFFTPSALSKFGDMLNKACGEKYLVSDEVYAKLTNESSPEGIFACVAKPRNYLFDENSLADGGFIILEDIQNPSNIGAIFRCAYSLGADKIIMSKGCADVYNPKTVRAAMGSLFKCSFCCVDDLCGFVHNQKQSGNRIICTALHEDSSTLGNFEFRSTDSIVFGNEGKGISRRLLEVSGQSLIIPMVKNAESLNAATAAAIIIWEMKKGIFLQHNS